MARVDIEKEMETIDPGKIKLYLDGFQDLGVSFDDGREYSKVRAVKAFPLSAAMHFIALRDEEEKEIGIIEDPGQLDGESREALKVELEKSYFMPDIIRINDIDEDFGVPKWDVETDKGHRTFELRSRRDARMMGRGRVLIKDIDGNRYQIPDYRKLDPRSRDLLEEEV